MNQFAARFAVKFESVEFLGEEAGVVVTVSGARKMLTTRDGEMVRKLRDWNLAAGALLFLYYDDAAHWYFKRPSVSGHMVDKNFRQTDEEES